MLPEGALDRLLSGSRVELRVAPGAVPGAPGPSPDAAKVARDVADNHPAMSSEVILMFIMVVSRDESLPDVGVKRHTVGANRMTNGCLSAGHHHHPVYAQGTTAPVIADATCETCWCHTSGTLSSGVSVHEETADSHVQCQWPARTAADSAGLA
ncbi:hypothetical protein EMIT0196MI5_140071 [Pseudomonas sp. IT-196MI5]